MSKKIRIASTADIPRNQGRAFPVDGRMIAVFHCDDGFFAIDDLCPHMGASLADGYLEDGAVACPWHAWRFSVRDGTWLDNKRLKVDCFAVHVEGDDIFIEWSDKNDSLNLE